MRLKSLWIDGFKNLNNFKIDFDDKDGTTILIGNNASGKSNVLEAISAIFAGLYNHKLKPNFNYKIKYSVEKPAVAGLIALNTDAFKDCGFLVEVKIQLKNNRYSSALNSGVEQYNNITKIKDVLSHGLPSQIIALYSGEESRLWENYYQKPYLDYNKKSLASDSYLHKLNMLYINKYYWDIALLTMYASDVTGLENIVKSELKEVNIEINTNLADNFRTSKPTNEVNNFIWDLLPVLANEKISKDHKSLTSWEVAKYVNLVLDEFKNRVNYKTHNELFNLLCVARLPKDTKQKLITNLELTFENGTTTKDLSEGQKKQILLKLALEVLADENSLLLFDEPDAHIHIGNKKLIPDMLNEYDGKRNIVLTTHSPTLAHSFESHNLRYLDNGKIDENFNNNDELIQNLTNGFMGASEQMLLLQSNKDIILLVEGNTDKTHIKTALDKLKNNYQNLEFEIFSIGYASHLANLISGLKTSELSKNKTYIAIFDYDSIGKEHSNIKTDKKSGKVKNFHKHKNTNIYELFICSDEHMKNNPKENFEIENIYPIKKQKEIYKQALDEVGEISEAEERYKKILANNCKDFDKSNFDGFKTLFDEINNIKNRTPK
jgi:predicted ATP-dependent endonuclease of OLD family